MLTVEVWVIFIWSIKCEYQIPLVKGGEGDIEQVSRNNNNNLNIFGCNAVFEKKTAMPRALDFMLLKTLTPFNFF